VKYSKIQTKYQRRLGLYGLGFLLTLTIGLVYYFEIYTLRIERFTELRVMDAYLVSIPEYSVVKPEVTHIPIPEEVRGIYWTAVTAGAPQKHIDYMIKSGLNTAVIDLKMDDGALAFEPYSKVLKPYVMKRPFIHDLDELLENLGKQNIYRIARIAVMRDGVYALEHQEMAVKNLAGNLWQDNIGSLWLDPSSQDVADYAINLGKEAYSRGFDEIQYDYVRFPSDGKLSNIIYPVFDQVKSKSEVMREFFKKVGVTLQDEEIPVSFDLFGMTFVYNSDFNIGQRLVDVYPYTDYISPMVYPSHYTSNFRGHVNPALAPYDIIYSTLESGIDILVSELGVSPEESRRKVRPWLQDFDIGAVYTSDLIEAQIEATRMASSSGWILWNARNVYETANYLP